MDAEGTKDWRIRELTDWLINGKMFQIFLELFGLLYIFALPKMKWPVGQGVKTPLFHGGITSSILVRATTKQKSCSVKKQLF